MPTGSMEKTLLVGDRIAVWKTHGAVPVRGEMVTHVYPVNRKDVFVKRIVAIPGDRVRITNKQLFVNGAAVSEPYVEHTTSYMDSYRDNFPSEPNTPLYPSGQEMLAKNVVNGEVVVPPGRYFVLGDNRDSSLDSRYWGFIEQADIIGTPKFVYYSVKPNENPSARESKLPILEVRWGRLFRKVA
jgi:signal peptidase I